MMICELLIDYRGSSRRVLLLFRAVFIVFLTAFLLLGVGFSLVNWGDASDPGPQMALWHGCTDLIIAVFVCAPAFALMRIVAYPVVPAEHRRCLSITKVATIGFTAIMVFRCVYNITHGLGCNLADQWFSAEASKPGKPTWKARVYQAVLVFVFDFCSSIAVIIGVRTWRANDVKFADTKFYRSELISTQDGEIGPGGRIG
jgi:hypothetical protein